MKPSVTASIVGVLLTLAAARFVLFGGGQTRPVYVLGKVERGSIISTVRASGTLKPATSAVVSSQVVGQVNEVLVDVNEPVKAGQVLAQLDPDSAQARLDTALADLEVGRQGTEIARRQVERARRDADNARALQVSAEADATHAELTAADARRDLKRKRQLGATGDVPPVETEHSKTAYDAASAGVASATAHAAAAADAFAAAQAAVDVAQAQLTNAEATVVLREANVRQAQVDVDHTIFRSPIDGVVVERNLVVGQSVGGSTAAVPLLTIAGDLQNLQVHASVDEADIGRVANGQEATSTFDAFPGQMFPGRVVNISTQPQPLQNVVAYDVVIGIDNAERKLLPGMTADVRIVVGHRDDVLKLPNAALRFRPADVAAEKQTPANNDGPEPVGGPAVWRLGRDGRPHADPVRTGLTDGTFTEIVDSGLANGDEIIVGMNQLSNAVARVGPLTF